MSHARSLLDALRSEMASLRGRRCLIAVSGGPDSVALLCGMMELRSESDTFLHVAHFNHRFRGDDSEADAVWVSELARSFGLEISIGRASQAAADFSEGPARETRYRFLAETADAFRADAVLTGHTRNDQVETILHHALRGTGLRGLAGMSGHRQIHGIQVVRPLIRVSRESILAYLAERGQEFRTDATNTDSRWTRNWLRQELLPLAEFRFPQAQEALLRLAEQAAETAELVSWLGRHLLEQATLERNTNSVELNSTTLMNWPASAIREMFVELWIRQRWPRREMSSDHWRRLADLVRVNSGAVTCPGGINVCRRKDRLVCTVPQVGGGEESPP